MNQKLTVMSVQLQSQNRIPKRVVALPRAKKELRISFDTKLKFIEVKGWSVADRIIPMYERLVKNINMYLENSDNLIVSFNYEMLNTTTIKYILSIIKAINKAHRLGKSGKIYWKVNANRDDAMAEAALDLSMMCDFEFQIITESAKINTKAVNDTQVIEHRKLLFGLHTKSRLAA